MEDRLFVPRDCYNSYFFPVESKSVSVIDKLRFHGKTFTQYLDGGSACHINLDEHLTKAQYDGFITCVCLMGEGKNPEELTEA